MDNGRENGNYYLGLRVQGLCRSGTIGVLSAVISYRERGDVACRG